MGLASRITNHLDIPGEPGEWVDIRKLPGRKLREAADVQQRAAFQHVKELGKEGLDAVRSVTADQIKTFKARPGSQYDPGTLLRAAIVAWSYSEKPTPDEIDDLDADVERWLIDEVVALSVPTRDEATVKNV